MALIKTFLPEIAAKILKDRSRRTGINVSQLVRDIIMADLAPDIKTFDKEQAETEAMAADYEARNQSEQTND